MTQKTSRPSVFRKPQPRPDKNTRVFRRGEIDRAVKPSQGPGVPRKMDMLPELTPAEQEERSSGWPGYLAVLFMCGAAVATFASLQAA